MPKYNKYAISSLICGILGLLIAIGYFIGVIVNFGMVNDIYDDERLLYLIGGVVAITSIPGMILSVRGERSQKVSTAKIGGRVSSFALLLLLFGLLLNGIYTCNRNPWI